MKQTTISRMDGAERRETNGGGRARLLARAVIAGAALGLSGCAATAGDGYGGAYYAPNYSPYYGSYGYSGSPYWGGGAYVGNTFVVGGASHGGHYGGQHILGGGGFRGSRGGFGGARGGFGGGRGGGRGGRH